MPPPPEAVELSLNTNLPLYKITTLNLNSLSANPTTSTGKQAQRHSNIGKAICALLRTNHILALQETHLGRNDHHALSTHLPNHHIFYNNYKRGQRGTILIVSNKILKHYHYDSQNSKTQHTQGRIQTVTFTPKTNSTHLPFRVINVYLQADDNATALETQLKYIKKLPSARHTYLLGDFNFIETPTDTSSTTTGLLISGTNQTLWNRVCEKHLLHEVRQPNHTYHFISSNLELCRSSRIDRIYVSFSSADLTLCTLDAFTPRLDINVTNSYESTSSQDRGKGLEKKKRFSDHTPVSLIPTSSRPTKKRSPNVPRWLADTPNFKNAIEEGLGDITLHSPFAALDRWKTAVRRACKRYFHEQRQQQQHYTTTTAELSASIKLLRLVTQPTPDNKAISAYLTTHSQLTKHLPDTTTLPIDDSRLRNHIHFLLTDSIDKTYEELTAIDPTEISLATLPDSSSPNTSPAQQSLLNDLKKILPSTRKRLTMLLHPDTGTPSSDPKEMANTIKTFWGKLWKRSGSLPPFSQILSYLTSYPTRVPRKLTPQLPTLDEITEHIHGTNNSAAGPDGIPFAFYRLCADTIAPILLAILTALAHGISPPAGYNYARLFLIPKNDSLDVADTRPISVTNADNRILAKTLTTVIAPALKAILHLSQKGFVPGRYGEDHILALNQAYYSALDRKQQHYILFLDTKKAFDSIHHEFILATLDILGMPQWFCCVVSGLLHQVRVFPVLGEDTGVSIPICRGVKQGCPLSPLLFVICYDVLLHKLAQANLPISQHAFADDLALASQNIDTIITALDTIQEFASHSGLGLNINKTDILTTRAPSYSDSLILREKGYGEIKFTNKATYLGVLMGSSISSIDIFAKAKKKFLDRVAQFRPVLSTIGLHKRILIFNIFILPVMYYLAQYFIIPYDEIVVPLRNITHKTIVPYNGGGYGYAQLIAPRDRMGPHTPLRDLWCTNYTRLASKYPEFAASHGEHLPQMGSHTGVHSYKWGSLLIDEHVAHAAFQYLEWFCPRDGTKRLQVHRLKGGPIRRRRLLYRDLLRGGYRKERSSMLTQYRSSLPNKLKRVLSLSTNTQAKQAAHNLRAHTRIASAKIPPFTRNVFFRLAHNALPTDCRRVEARMKVRRRTPRGSPGSPYPCYLCGEGEDSLHHLLTVCAVVRSALALVSKATKCNIPYDRNHLTLNFQPTSTNLATNIIIYFTTAVWKQRSDYFSTLDKPPPHNTATNRITTYALDQLTPRPKQNNISTSKEIGALALNPPSTAIVCFTDGSAIPNPGPCGSGVVCTAPPITPNTAAITCKASIGLGPGDNNLGEFQAILTALTIEHHITPLYKQPPPLLIFSDSLLAICYILHGWKLANANHTARSARRTFKRISKRRTARLYWVRGHAQVPGNEEADQEAKDGASATHRGATPSRPSPIRLAFSSSLPKTQQRLIRRDIGSGKPLP